MARRWYKPDGTRVEAGIREAREGAFHYPVTGVLNVYDKPGLNNWMANGLARHAYEVGFQAGAAGASVSPSEALPEAKARWDAERDTAPRRGTQAHLAAETYALSGRLPDGLDLWSRDDLLKLCQTVTDWLPEGDWQHEVGVSHPLGYGGTVDLFCWDWVVDLKTHDKLPDTPPSRLAYKNSHAAQLAAYRRALSHHGLCAPDAKCVNLFLSVLEPGAITVKEWSEKDLEWGLRWFDIGLEACFHKDNHDPRELAEAV